MKNLKIKTFIILSLVFLNSSCNEEFLDRTPQDRFTESDVYSSKASIEAYVNARYNGLYTFGQMDWWFSEPHENFLSPLSDESHYLFGFWKVEDIVKGGMTPDNLGAFQNKWKESYKEIRNCNIFFKNIGQAQDVSESDIAKLTDEVRFVRAYIYADLFKYFGGVPLITEPIGLNDEFKVARNSIDETVNFIVQELDQIIANKALAESYFKLNSTNKGRANIAATHALKARVLVYAASKLFNPNNDRSKWERASEACKAAYEYTTAQGHGLYDNYQRIFLDHYNKEVIFDKALNSDKNLNRSWLDEHLNPNGYNGWGSIMPTQDFVEAYETQDGKYISDPTSGYSLDQFWVNRDPRMYATVLYDGAQWKGRAFESFVPGGLDSRDGPGNWNTSKTGYNWKKHLDPSVTDYGGPGKGRQHVILLRYAEVLLNYAETQIELGNEEEARNYINMVRAREGVNMPPIDDSGQDLVDRYRNERRVELVLEGHRYHDLRRWKIAEEVLNNFKVQRITIEKQEDGSKEYSIEDVQTYFFPEKYYLVPIPRSEIDKSGQVLVQNPGY